jgi:hypothetical protein
MAPPRQHWHAPVAKEWLREIYSNNDETISDEQFNLIDKMSLEILVCVSKATDGHHELVSLGVLYSLHSLMIKKEEKISITYTPDEFYFLVMMANFKYNSEYKTKVFAEMKKKYNFNLTVSDEIKVLELIKFNRGLNRNVYTLQRTDAIQKLITQNDRLASLLKSIYSLHKQLDIVGKCFTSGDTKRSFVKNKLIIFNVMNDQVHYTDEEFYSSLNNIKATCTSVIDNLIALSLISDFEKIIKSCDEILEEIGYIETSSLVYNRLSDAIKNQQLVKETLETQYDFAESPEDDYEELPESYEVRVSEQKEIQRVIAKKEFPDIMEYDNCALSLEDLGLDNSSTVKRPMSPSFDLFRSKSSKLYRSSESCKLSVSGEINNVLVPDMKTTSLRS